MSTGAGTAILFFFFTLNLTFLWWSFFAHWALKRVLLYVKHTGWAGETVAVWAQTGSLAAGLAPAERGSNSVQAKERWYPGQSSAWVTALQLPWKTYKCSNDFFFLFLFSLDKAKNTGLLFKIAVGRQETTVSKINPFAWFFLWHSSHSCNLEKIINSYLDCLVVCLRKENWTSVRS